VRRTIYIQPSPVSSRDFSVSLYRVDRPMWITPSALSPFIRYPEAGTVSLPSRKENDRGFSRDWQLRRDFSRLYPLGDQPSRRGAPPLVISRPSRRHPACHAADMVFHIH
jgi:hypothetical protein